jgi:hypothetical protein
LAWLGLAWLGLAWLVDGWNSQGIRACCLEYGNNHQALWQCQWRCSQWRHGWLGTIPGRRFPKVGDGLVYKSRLDKRSREWLLMYCMLLFVDTIQLEEQGQSIGGFPQARAGANRSADAHDVQYHSLFVVRGDSIRSRECRSLHGQSTRRLSCQVRPQCMGGIDEQYSDGVLIACCFGLFGQ